ncbi:hypothetical protein [Pseudonocardia pini]|uniref:hypothetical protein n=1 Tax=Pseudonocardia pini TaxID=2758030 RepID=UPI0015F07EC6|nr:hypothetical protein [Pseudonocardia pini]
MSELPVSRRPRCPEYIKIDTVDELLPYLRAVADRPYQAGALHATWDLQPGERILLRTDNWHDPLVVDACAAVLKEYGCEFEIETLDRGPKPEFDGYDEIDIMLALTAEVTGDMERWADMDRNATYDKVLWGFGGPVLGEANMKIARMPFVSRELVANPGNLIPGKIISAIDEWTDSTIKRGSLVRVTDPEGTDLTFPLPDHYFAPDRSTWNMETAQDWWPQSPDLIAGYMPGHITARPLWMSPEPGVDGINGVIAGTMNHIGPYPRLEMTVENGRITSIEGGGVFGDKLRELEERTKDLQYPGFPGPGLLWLFEVSIGTNPKVHRPRDGYLQGWICGIIERTRSGIIHLGYGTVVTSAREVEAANLGHPVGHWHTHLNFPTVTIQTPDGEEVLLIDEGRLKALDDPKVRAIAAEIAGEDADYWLDEAWVPAVPGLNCEGSYEEYAADPTAWTKAELQICRTQHPMFMRMVGAEHGLARPSTGGHAGCGH